ncbi:MAG TPA: squalene synthase HpnC [Planctomycetota bacterium]|nr:squalene synthase HpnC [Planctomycetota bacterium]
MPAPLLIAYQREFAGQAKRTPAAAQAYCENLARTHYENFSVGSLLIPKNLRRHMFAVYAFCRWADDLGDESASPEEAREALRWWRGELEALYAGITDASAPAPEHLVYLELRNTIREFAIPAQPFHDLITAFEMDQDHASWATFGDLCTYCRHSANPVGRLVLYLFRVSDPARQLLSDQICTGLQLANFWQDIARDLKINRVYLPAEDMKLFAVTRADLEKPTASHEVRALLKFEVDRTQTFFDAGKPLWDQVPRELAKELKLFVRGGESVLESIRRQDYDTLVKRPRVTRLMKARLLAGAMLGM